MRIAQRFSVGKKVWHSLSPEGTVESGTLPRPSLRDYTASAVDPNAEALGYCRMSLRDKGGSKQWKSHPRSNPSGIGLESLPYTMRGSRAVDTVTIPRENCLTDA
jgi:hypothetical protein